MIGVNSSPWTSATSVVTPERQETTSGQRLALAIVYFGLITPVGFVSRLARDPLHRRWDRKIGSYLVFVYLPERVNAGQSPDSHAHGRRSHTRRVGRKGLAGGRLPRRS